MTQIEQWGCVSGMDRLLVSDWLLKARAPFWSESYCYLWRAIDFAGFSHAIH